MPQVTGPTSGTSTSGVSASKTEPPHQESCAGGTQININPGAQVEGGHTTSSLSESTAPTTNTPPPPLPGESPFERMAQALKVLTVSGVTTGEAAKTAGTSRTNQAQLAAEVNLRRRTDFLISAWREKFVAIAADRQARVAAEVSDFRSTFTLHDALMQLGCYAQAEVMARSAFEGAPYVTHCNYLARTRLQLGSEGAEAAMQVAQEGCKLFPYSSELAVAMARAHLLNGDRAAAQAALEKIEAKLGHVPTETDYLLARAEVLQTSESIEMALERVHHPNEFSEGALKIAKLYAGLGNKNKFVEWMEVAIKAPVDTGMWMDVALSPQVAKHGEGAPWGTLRRAALQALSSVQVPTMEEFKALGPKITEVCKSHRADGTGTEGAGGERPDRRRRRQHGRQVHNQ